jgi:hypothetical protein
MSNISMKKTKPTKQWKYVMLFLPMAVPVQGHLWNTGQYRFIPPTNLSMILIYLLVIKSLNNNGKSVSSEHREDDRFDPDHSIATGFSPAAVHGGDDRERRDPCRLSWPRNR